jgi:hypothetical protein
LKDSLAKIRGYTCIKYGIILICQDIDIAIFIDHIS